ncbi:Hypothetical predicted protein [Cloeon dipterum]|nr:Hypothetical predicted protein [Cloeon dipterum]
MDNSVVESPLEVLSRAATMVQLGVAKGDSLGKEVQPSARWRRERRPCPTARAPRPMLANNNDDDSPLDMSTRGRRGSDEAASNAGQRGGPSDSDPVIDEHFRRSLGQDYLAIFPPSSHAGPAASSAASAALNKRTPSPNKTPFDPSDDATFTPLTVDDHFAKALGETWHQLQASKKDNEDKSSSSTPSSASSTPPASPSVVSAAV